MSLEDELSNAITMFRDKLDSRPMAKSENSVQAGIQERGASFSSQLPIAATNEPRSGNANNDTQQNPPTVPISTCLGFSKGNLTITVAGISICTTDYPSATDPNGVFSLPFFQPFPAAGGVLAYCQYQLIVGGNAYLVQLFSDGSTSAFVLLGGLSGASYFEGSGSVLSDTIANTFTGPCGGTPDQPGFGGTVDLSF